MTARPFTPTAAGRRSRGSGAAPRGGPPSRRLRRETTAAPASRVRARRSRPTASWSPPRARRRVPAPGAAHRRTLSGCPASGGGTPPIPARRITGLAAHPAPMRAAPPLRRRRRSRAVLPSRRGPRVVGAPLPGPTGLRKVPADQDAVGGSRRVGRPPVVRPRAAARSSAVRPRAVRTYAARRHAAPPSARPPGRGRPWKGGRRRVVVDSSSMGLPWLMGVGLEEVLEQGAIVDHCHPQVFGRGLTALLADGDVVRDTVVLHDVRMVYRDVRGALLEVAHGVTSELHEVGDEAVGFDHGALRVVDESSLVGSPRFSELPSVLFVDRLDVQLLYAVDTGAELALGVPRIAMLADQPLILGTEFRMELVRPALLHEHERDDDDRQRDQHADD